MLAGPRSTVGSASNSQARKSGFDTWSGHLLPFFPSADEDLVLINRLECLRLPRNILNSFTDRTDMTIGVKQQNHNNYNMLFRE